MPAGVMMTANNTGGKNTIMGTVSFGGSDAAFCSASIMRVSRLSCETTRNACPNGVPYDIHEAADPGRDRVQCHAIDYREHDRLQPGSAKQLVGSCFTRCIWLSMTALAQAAE